MMKFKYVIVFITMISSFVTIKAQNNELIQTIKDRKISEAIELIQKSDLNTMDSEGLTALHWACRRSLTTVVNALIDAGVNLATLDKRGYSAFDYARKTHNSTLISLMLENGATAFNDDRASYFDGPFIDRRPEGLYAYYLVHDGKTKRTKYSGRYLDENESIIDTWMGEKYSISINEESVTPEWRIETSEPICVLGDIHGEYDRMIHNLCDNKVIDKNLNWIFGKGHLVYVGDVFDRGEKSN